MLLYHIISQSPPAAKRQVMPSGKACLLQQGGEKPWICIDTETSSLLSCAGHVVRLWLQNVQQMGWAMVWITWHTLQTYPQVLVETLWGNLAEMLPEEFIEISLGSLKLKKAWRLQHDFNMSTVFQGSSILQTIRIIQNISEPTDFNHVPGPILLESHFVGKSPAPSHMIQLTMWMLANIGTPKRSIYTPGYSPRSTGLIPISLSAKNDHSNQMGTNSYVRNCEYITAIMIITVVIYNLLLSVWC